MSYNECYNVCSGNGTNYCALQGDRCICSDTYVRSSVDHRDSAASTRTQMRQSVITGLFQATQRCRMKSIIVGNYFQRWKWHHPCHLDAYQNREESTAPPQSSELTLTRVMSPNGPKTIIHVQFVRSRWAMSSGCTTDAMPMDIRDASISLRWQPHQQGNSISNQLLQHSRPASRRTIAPRQRRRIVYHFLLFQTHQQNLPDLHDQRKGHLQVLQLQHQILDFVLLATTRPFCPSLTSCRRRRMAETLW